MTDTRIDYTLEEVPVHLIDIGERQRKDLGDIDSLAANIDAFGLHTTVTLLDKEYMDDDAIEGDPEKPYLLIAGERRLTAISNLGWDTIPAKITKRDLDEWEIRVIELDENLRRKKMTPLEEARSKEAIHRLYQEKYGEATTGPGDSGHSMNDTAKILGESRANLSYDLKIAQYGDAIPELAQAKTKAEAKKIIKATEQKLMKEELAKREEKRREGSGEAAKERNRHELLMKRFILGDYFEQMRNLEPRTMDLVELDPDWGINFKEKVQNRGSLTADDYETLEPEDYIAGLKRMLKEAYRVLKDNSWLIVWYSLEEWHDTTREAITEAGFKVCAAPAIWVHDANRTTTPAYRLGQRIEAFFYARKGNARIQQMGHPQTFVYRTLKQNERSHPAAKPIELYTDILNTFIGDRKGANITSGFAGSGNIILAADNLEHNALGFDLSESYRDDYVLKVSQGTPGTFKSYLD